ncbi:MAG TPA: hypothetical protein ENI08_02870 [Candidatus Dependentiae bacterium]|nr:hypothetical protein [Candidatus Dependentiae bacterium]
MALRIRKDGRILCAAMHLQKHGDTYLHDGISYKLTVEFGIIVTEPMNSTEGRGGHSKHGEWWWSNEVPNDVAIESKENSDLNKAWCEMLKFGQHEGDCDFDGECEKCGAKLGVCSHHGESISHRIDQMNVVLKGLVDEGKYKELVESEGEGGIKIKRCKYCNKRIWFWQVSGYDGILKVDGSPKRIKVSHWKCFCNDIKLGNKPACGDCQNV